VGVDAAAARDAADQLDRAALAAIGLEFGEFQPTGHAALSRHLPLTSGTKAVIRQTLAHAAVEKAQRMTSRHILLALPDPREPDPAAAPFAPLSVDQRDVRERRGTAAERHPMRAHSPVGRASAAPHHASHLPPDDTMADPGAGPSL